MTEVVKNEGKSMAKLDEETLVRNKVLYRLNDIRLQPVKQLPMQIFLMWMVGNSISIFTIMFVGNAVISPLQQIMNTSTIFEEFEEDAKRDKQIKSSLSQSKLIYIACCLAAFCVALLKLSWMDMLPIASMDWMNHAPPSYKESSFAIVH